MQFNRKFAFLLVLLVSLHSRFFAFAGIPEAQVKILLQSVNLVKLTFADRIKKDKVLFEKLDRYIHQKDEEEKIKLQELFKLNKFKNDQIRYLHRYINTVENLMNELKLIQTAKPTTSDPTTSEISDLTITDLKSSIQEIPRIENEIVNPVVYGLDMGDLMFKTMITFDFLLNELDSILWKANILKLDENDLFFINEILLDCFHREQSTLLLDARMISMAANSYYILVQYNENSSIQKLAIELFKKADAQNILDGRAGCNEAILIQAAQGFVVKQTNETRSVVENIFLVATETSIKARFNKRYDALLEKTAKTKLEPFVKQFLEVRPISKMEKNETIDEAFQTQAHQKMHEALFKTRVRLVPILSTETAVSIKLQ